MTLPCRAALRVLGLVLVPAFLALDEQPRRILRPISVAARSPNSRT